MRSNRQLIAYIIFGLIVIGLISSFIQNPGPFLIPLVVLGGVFLLYKFPPRRMSSLFKSKPNSGRSYSSTRSSTKPPGGRRKTTFRVIKGNKRDDDEPPRYH